MTQLALATLMAGSVWLFYIALIETPASGEPRSRQRRSIRQWLDHAGLSDVGPAEFITVTVSVMLVGAAAGITVFGSITPAVAIAIGAGVFIVGAYRRRANQRRVVAHDAWPRIIEEMRVLIGSSGRSVPNALFDAGHNGPDEIQHAFDASHREWLLTTNFEATLQVLKQRLADPTVDMVCETLLIAHELGGNDVDTRLGELAEDRRVDMQGRRDAEAQQAGARFARRFVLLVPLGMAVAGMSVGNGRDAYRTSTGQLMVLAALSLIALCWIWAGRVMALPEEQRVFSS